MTCLTFPFLPKFQSLHSMPNKLPDHMGRIQRFFVAAFSQGFVYKLAAILMAFVLWLTLRAESPVDADVPIQLELILDSSLTLVGQRPQLTAYVVGSSRSVNRLAFDPPIIRRSFGPATPDSVQIELSNDDVMIPSGVSATVRNVQPRHITLYFASRVSRSVPVISNVTIRAGNGVRFIGPMRVSPDSVTVSGIRRSVMSLEGIPTVDTTVLVTSADPVLIPLDTAATVLHVTPAHVQLHVPVIVDSGATGLQMFLPFRTK